MQMLSRDSTRPEDNKKSLNKNATAHHNDAILHSPKQPHCSALHSKMRLLRTNSSEETFVENITIFKLRLRARGYPNNLIEKTLSEVKYPDRQKALKDNTRVQKEILPFVTQYNPSVPNLKHILMEKWHLIESQPKLKEMFKEPPIIYYKRGISLRDILVVNKIGLGRDSSRTRDK